MDKCSHLLQQAWLLLIHFYVFYNLRKLKFNFIYTNILVNHQSQLSKERIILLFLSRMPGFTAYITAVSTVMVLLHCTCGCYGKPNMDTLQQYHKHNYHLPPECRLAMIFNILNRQHCYQLSEYELDLGNIFLLEHVFTNRDLYAL